MEQIGHQVQLGKRAAARHMLWHRNLASGLSALVNERPDQMCRAHVQQMKNSSVDP